MTLAANSILVLLSRAAASLVTLLFWREQFRRSSAGPLDPASTGARRIQLGATIFANVLGAAGPAAGGAGGGDTREERHADVHWHDALDGPSGGEHESPDGRSDHPAMGSGPKTARRLDGDADGLAVSDGLPSAVAGWWPALAALVTMPS